MLPAAMFLGQGLVSWPESSCGSTRRASMGVTQESRSKGRWLQRQPSELEPVVQRVAERRPKRKCGWKHG